MKVRKFLKEKIGCEIEMKTQGLPFIHLIKTPLNNYAYDVNTNAFIELGDETYAYLKALLDSGDPGFPAPPEVEHSMSHLRAQGFFSAKHPKKIEHIQSSLMEYRLNENIKQMTLQITQECNFRCSYCTYGAKDFQYQREHSSKKMSLETALSVVDFLVAHSTNQDEVVIGFYGGEPLLEFEKIRTIVEYAEKNFFGKDLGFSLTTNGSLLTLEIAKFFAAHNFNLIISLDGTPETHDRSRKFAATGNGTFATIKKNLDEIKREFPAFFKRISFNIVIDPRYSCNNLHTLFNEDDTFKESQIMSTVIDDFFSTEKAIPSDIFVRENNYHRFKAYLALLGRYPLTKVSRIAEDSILASYRELEDNLKMSTELSDIMAPGGPCIPGERRVLVSVDGIFYPCERVSETSEPMMLGNLCDGFDVEKARKVLNIGQLTEEDCKNCWAIRHCSICAKHCDNIDELCAQLKRSQCDQVKEAVELQFKEYLLLKDFDVPINTIGKRR